MNGSDINVISKSLGHRDIKNTQIYAQLNLTTTKRSIEEAFKEI